MTRDPQAADPIVVIGAGLAGLAAARELVHLGRRVVVLEAAPVAGGLAESIEFGDARIERFYHFICTVDHDLLGLCEELGLSDSIHWARGGTAFFHDGAMYPFANPIDLLRFEPEES